MTEPSSPPLPKRDYRNVAWFAFALALVALVLVFIADSRKGRFRPVETAIPVLIALNSLVYALDLPRKRPQLSRVLTTISLIAAVVIIGFEMSSIYTAGKHA